MGAKPSENTTFAEVLRGKMTTPPSENPASSPNNEQISEVKTHILEGELLFFRPKQQFSQGKRHFYDTKMPKIDKKPHAEKAPKPTLEKPNTKTATPPQPEYSVTKLSRAAQLALQSLGLGTNEKITFSEVKKSYRRLARKLHPDVIGKQMPPSALTKTTVSFIELKSQADLVLHELNSLKKTSS